MRSDVYAQRISMRDGLALNRDGARREVTRGAHIENDAVCAHVKHAVVERGAAGCIEDEVTRIKPDKAALQRDGGMTRRSVRGLRVCACTNHDERKGGEQPLPARPHAYRNPRLSPDGQRVAITIDELGSQEWLLDIGRGTLTRLTFEGSYNGAIAWTPDGKRIAFGTDRAGARNLFWQLADGSGGAERLAASDHGDIASSWSPDGQTLAYEEATPGAGYDLWVYRLSDHKTQPFLQTRFNEIAPRFSPDGRWLAYASDESGRYEIYVQPYPGPGGKWQISTDGGTEPVWARNGELFYRNGDKMMAVETNTKSTFSADKPNLLFERHYATYNTMPAYDVTPDGQRFLLAKTGGQAPEEINVVLNWVEELKQKAPTGKN